MWWLGYMWRVGYGGVADGIHVGFLRGEGGGREHSPPRNSLTLEHFGIWTVIAPESPGRRCSAKTIWILEGKQERRGL